MVVQNRYLAVLCVALFALLGLSLGGCSSTGADIRAVDPALSLREYRTIYVEKVTAAPGVNVPGDVLAVATNKIAANLSGTRTFDTVTETPPAAGPYAKLTVRVIKFEPGSRVARLLAPGFGSSTYKLDVAVTDGTTGHPLAHGVLTEFWGWGGSLGTVKGIEDLITDGSTHVATGVIRVFAQNGP